MEEEINTTTKEIVNEKEIITEVTLQETQELANNGVEITVIQENLNEEKKQEETSEIKKEDDFFIDEHGVKRRKDNGQIAPGNTANPDGRGKDTPEKIIEKKAIKQIIAEYKEKLANILPEIEPVIKKKALEGDMTAIKEIHDRVMDKSKQPTDITSDGEKINPILVKFIDDKSEDNRNTTGV